MNYTPIDFKSLLLDDYKKIGLSEKQVIVILMVDQLINQGNKLITADLLALKMNYKSKEIDAILVELLKAKLIEYDYNGLDSSDFRTSLEPLRKKLYAQLEKDMAENSARLMSSEKADKLGRLYDYFEQKLSRTLSPIEKDLIQAWLNDGYEEKDIKDALDDSYVAGKRTLKSVDKMLRSNQARKDIKKEGYSGVSEKWNKDIEKTIEIAKTKWLDDLD